jgi:hypothetical protein
MADVHAPLKHPTTAALAPAPPVPYTAWNEALGFASGLSPYRLAVAYESGAPNANLVLTNEIVLVNNPCRMSLVATSAELANFTAPVKFNKSIPLAAGVLNSIGTTLRIRAGGRLSTHATTPGSWGYSVWLNDFPSGQNLGGSNPITLTAAVTDVSWSIDAVGITRSGGTSGIVFPGTVDVAVPAPNPPQIVRLGTVGQNLTLTSTIDFWVQGSVSSASNRTTLEWAYVDIAYPSNFVT